MCVFLCVSGTCGLCSFFFFFFLFSPRRNSISEWKGSIGYDSGENTFEFGEPGYWSFLFSGSSLSGKDPSQSGDYKGVLDAIDFFTAPDVPEPFLVFLPSRGSRAFLRAADSIFCQDARTHAHPKSLPCLPKGRTRLMGHRRNGTTTSRRRMSRAPSSSAAEISRTCRPSCRMCRESPPSATSRGFPMTFSTRSKVVRKDHFCRPLVAPTVSKERLLY